MLWTSTELNLTWYVLWTSTELNLTWCVFWTSTELNLTWCVLWTSNELITELNCSIVHACSRGMRSRTAWRLASNSGYSVQMANEFTIGMQCCCLLYFVCVWWVSYWIKPLLCKPVSKLNRKALAINRSVNFDTAWLLSQHGSVCLIPWCTPCRRDWDIAVCPCLHIWPK